ncbi:polyprenyl synthetase family protein [Nocardia brasiliensis]|uniref:polyprenyl synthetase family protein n=1 Tax=Nocardia brasiliensis TaxID=37326 RepID=UPI003D933D5D
MASYHFGWCDPAGNKTRAGWGKGLRAALVFAASAACGADADDAVSAATAVELIHNFTLVHDDVMDADRRRRGRATVWAEWGVPQAICLGDALHALAIEVLTTMQPVSLGHKAVDRLETTVVELCRGQTQDCMFDTQRTVRTDEYLAMARGKTAALTGCACALGALSAQAPDDLVANLDTFGREIGLAFQIVDDVIGIWGDPAATGKPVGSDIAHRKRTLPTTLALNAGTGQATELGRLYRSTAPMTTADIKRAKELLDECEAERIARRYAADRVTAAIAALHDDPKTSDLRALAHFVTRRDR